MSSQYQTIQTPVKAKWKSKPWLKAPKGLAQSPSNSPGMAEAEEEAELENTELAEFYKKSFTELDLMPLAIHHGVAQALSERVYCSSLSESDWKDIAAHLGWQDPDHLKLIGYFAKIKDNLPFYTFLVNNFNTTNKSFGLFVRTLLKMTPPRYDLLRILKPFAQWRLRNPGGDYLEFLDLPVLKAPEHFKQSTEQILLSINKALTRKSSIEQISFAEKTHSFIHQETACNENYSKNHEKRLMVEKSMEPGQNCLSNGRRQHEHSLDDNTNQENLPNITEPENNCQERNNKTPFNFSEFAPSLTSELSNRIVVFITHSYNDYGRAKLLAEVLKNHGFVVYIQGAMDVMLRQDASHFIHQMQQKVDFVIPIISIQYLEDISISPDPDFDDLDRTWVRLIFKAYQNTLVNQQCLNFKIEPYVLNEVVGPTMRYMKTHLEFRATFKENQVSRMIEVMQDIFQRMVHR